MGTRRWSLVWRRDEEEVLQLSVGARAQAGDGQECPASPFNLLNTPNPSVMEKCHLNVLLKTNTNTNLVFAEWLWEPTLPHFDSTVPQKSTADPLFLNFNKFSSLFIACSSPALLVLFKLAERHFQSWDTFSTSVTLNTLMGTVLRNDTGIITTEAIVC